MSKYKINCHSSIRIESRKIIYFDPFKIEKAANDADIVFITHDHYDHFSPADLRKVMKNDTTLIMPSSCTAAAEKEGFNTDSIIFVRPGDLIYVKDISVRVVSSYNKNKIFHPEKNKWAGYLINNGDERIYVAGDTDALSENESIECDLAFVPVGGTYTMTSEEAADFVNKMKPVKAIPTHYGSITGNIDDGEKFVKLIDKTIKTEILI